MEKNINPKYNKLRIVFAVDKDGEPISYLHVQKSEAKRIFALLKYLARQPDWVSLDKVKKVTNITDSTLERLIRIMAGALWADIRVDGEYEKKIPGRMIHMKNRIMNSKTNALKKLKFLKAPIYVKRART